MSNDEPERILDQYLVNLAQSGSRESFERLARRWTPRLQRFAARNVGRSDLARDIVQETWIGAIRGLQSLADPASFPAWIYAIAQRKCVDAIRAGQRWRKRTDEMQREAGVTEQDDSAARAPGEALDLASALTRLNDEQRTVVALFYGEDLSVSEIAEVLAVPAGTVKSRLFHARETLKKLLGE